MKICEKRSLESQTIEFLRFPLAVMVIFIHSTRKPIPLNLDLLHENPLCIETFYNLCRVLLSDVVPAIAVPMFFLFSGRYFFSDCTDRFSISDYVKKLRKRGRTFLIPFIMWNIIAVFLIFLTKLVFMILYGGDINSFVEYLRQNGWANVLWGGNVYYKSTNILNIVMLSTSPANVPMWFIRDLMVIVLFSPLVYYSVRKSGLFLIVLLLCYIFNVWIPLSGFSVTSYFFFSIGAFACIKNIDIIVFCRKIGWWIIPVTVILMLPSLLLYGEESALRVYSRPIYVLCACIATIKVSSCLVEYGIVKNRIFLTKSCFFIYAIHTLLILGICASILDFIIPGNGYVHKLVSYLCLPVITVICCLIIFKIMSHYMPKTLSLLTGNR